MPSKAIVIGLACLLAINLSYADEKLLFEQLQQAMRKHDIKVLKIIIAPTTRVEVIWTDVQPKQRFTLSKAQYLQQIRALWRFGSEDNYQFSEVKWQQGIDNNSAQLFFRQTETRQLFSKSSGQRSDISLSLAKTTQSWEIVAIKSEISMW